jgi:hypothetical protein
MALAYDAERRPGRPASAPTPSVEPAFTRAGRASEPNSISASQARAARRREALSNQRAVAAWLRELSRGR